MSALFDKLCSTNCLYSAWKNVKTKNSSGGIDGLSVLDFDDNLSLNLISLQKELAGKKWLPEPYLRIEIRKNETEKRKLGLLTVKDKIVQQAIRSLIEPRFENLFLNNSYGYRPGRGHLRAIRRSVSEFNAKNNEWVVQLDLDNYFDTINHDILFTRLKSMIVDPEVSRLIELCVKMGVVTTKKKWTDVTVGLPQGALCTVMHKPPYA